MSINFNSEQITIGLIHSHHCDDKVTTPVTAHSTTPVTACSTSLESFDKGPSGNDHASHQKPYRQPDDMVTGATGGVTSGKIHEQLPAHSTSLESFDKGPSGNSHASQLVTSESRIQDVQDGSNKAAHTKKPVIPVLSTEESIGIVIPSSYFSRLMVVFILESEAEVPRTSHAAAVRSPGKNVTVKILVHHVYMWFVYIANCACYST